MALTNTVGADLAAREVRLERVRWGTRLSAWPRGWLRSPLLLVLIVSLACWVIGRGIPYGYDSLEVYFTYLVGFNAANFSVVNPLMADIAASTDPAAHPYYYTHHPNLFAHLSTQMLIRAGLTDLAFHSLLAIVATLIGMWLANKFLRKMLGAPVATLTMVIFALHYVGVISWSTNLLRALHFPLFWFSLYSLQLYLERPLARRLMYLLIGIFAVFLNDYTLGPFVLLTCLIVFWLSKQQLRTKLGFTISTTAAACLAVGLWLAVLISTLGVDVVRQDIVYTYLGRNASDALDSQTVLAFYQAHHMVFWDVFVPTTDRWGLILDAYRGGFTLGQGALGPVLYAAVGLTLLGALWHASFCRTRLRSVPEPLVLATYVALVGVVWAAIGSRQPDALLAWQARPAAWLLGPLGLVALVSLLGGLSLKLLASRISKLQIGQPDQVKLTISLTTNSVKPNQAPPVITTLVKEVAFWLGSNNGPAEAPIPVRNYVIALGLAGALMTWAAIGAFTANFVSTYKPSLVFLEDVVLAVLLVSLWRAALRFPWFSVRRVVVLLALGGVMVYWLGYQVRLAERLPPFEIGGAEALRSEAFRGASFAAPDMHAVVFYYTRGWAESILHPGGGKDLDFDALMFFANREARADTYRHPMYLACVRQNVQAAEDWPCGGWDAALRTLGYPVVPGIDELLRPDFLIFQFPNGGTWSPPINRLAPH